MADTDKTAWNKALFELVKAEVSSIYDGHDPQEIAKALVQLSKRTRIGHTTQIEKAVYLQNLARRLKSLAKSEGGASPTKRTLAGLMGMSIAELETKVEAGLNPQGKPPNPLFGDFVRSTDPEPNWILPEGSVLYVTPNDKHEPIQLRHVKRTTGKGRGESYLFKSDDDRRFFVKTPRFNCSEGSASINDRLLKLKAAQPEFQSLDKLRGMSNVAELINLAHSKLIDSQSVSHDIPLLVSKWIDGKTWEDYCRNELRRGWDNEEKHINCEDKVVSWLTLVKKLVTTLGEVHRTGGIVHGDLNPSNVIVNLSGDPYLVDFGEAFMLSAGGLSGTTTSPTRYATGYEGYISPQLRAALVGLKPGSLHAAWPDLHDDIYSLGGLMYFAATGEHPTATFYTLTAFKLRETVFNKIRDTGWFDEHHEWIAHIIVQCLATEITDRLAHTDDVLNLLSTFARAAGLIPHEEMVPIAKLAENIANRVKNLDEKPVFRDIVRKHLGDLQRNLQLMEATNRVEIAGTRNEILQGILDYMSLLKEGDEYLTFSEPRFWTSKNLGIRGRFMTMNAVLARRKVSIRRIFLIDPDAKGSVKFSENEDDTLSNILEAQAEFVSELEKQKGITSDSGLGKPGIFVGWVDQSPAQHERPFGPFTALFSIHMTNGEISHILLSFQLDRVGEMRRVHLSHFLKDLRGIEKLKQQMAEVLQKASPIATHPIIARHKASGK